MIPDRIQTKRLQSASPFLRKNHLPIYDHVLGVIGLFEGPLAKLSGIMIHMNLFRVLGDVSHTVSKCILIWAIHSNKSAEGHYQTDISSLQFTYQITFRCLLDHPSFIRHGFLHSIPRSVLGTSRSVTMELRSQELLYIFFSVYHFLNDAGLRTYTRTGKGLEFRSILSRWIYPREPNGCTSLQEVEWF